MPCLRLEGMYTKFRSDCRKRQCGSLARRLLEDWATSEDTRGWACLLGMSRSVLLFLAAASLKEGWGKSRARSLWPQHCNSESWRNLFSPNCGLGPSLPKALEYLHSGMGQCQIWLLSTGLYRDLVTNSIRSVKPLQHSRPDIYMSWKVGGGVPLKRELFICLDFWWEK